MVKVKTEVCKFCKADWYRKPCHGKNKGCIARMYIEDPNQFKTKKLKKTKSRVRLKKRVRLK